MRLGYCFSLLLALSISLVPVQLNAQEVSAQPGSGAKVCVAIISNRTTTALLEERMAARLAKEISDKKLSGMALESRTTDDRELRPTLENSREMKEKDCEYLVLTQVADQRIRSTVLRTPENSIGGRPPSTDASDSQPVSRDNLEINFAVFRPGNPKPVVDGKFFDRPSSNSADSLMQAMDREGTRINHELKKK